MVISTMNHHIVLAKSVDDSMNKLYHCCVSCMFSIESTDIPSGVLRGVAALAEIFTLHCEQEICSDRDYTQGVYYQGYPEYAYVAETVYADVIKDHVQNSADTCR